MSVRELQRQIHRRLHAGRQFSLKAFDAFAVIDAAYSAKDEPAFPPAKPPPGGWPEVEPPQENGDEWKNA